MTTGEQFDALESKDQWPFVLALGGDRGMILIILDNDNTCITFPDEPADKDGWQDSHNFKDYVGWHDGTIFLLRALGFTVEPA